MAPLIFPVSLPGTKVNSECQMLVVINDCIISMKTNIYLFSKVRLSNVLLLMNVFLFLEMKNLFFICFFLTTHSFLTKISINNISQFIVFSFLLDQQKTSPQQQQTKYIWGFELMIEQFGDVTLEKQLDFFTISICYMVKIIS